MGDISTVETAGDLAPLEPVAAAYKNAIRVRVGLFWLVLSVIAVILDQALLADTEYRWLPTMLIPALGMISVVTVPERIYRRIGFRVTDRLLQLVRGWMFHTDTIVPFVRVQHIDITRGPVEKMFGISTLVVHTAGTHNSIVSVPGLSPETAARIRDTIREHVRTDFE